MAGSFHPPKGSIPSQGEPVSTKGSAVAGMKGHRSLDPKPNYPVGNFKPGVSPAKKLP